MKHKYFVSFNLYSSGVSCYGNTILEHRKKITDIEDIVELQDILKEKIDEEEGVVMILFYREIE